LGLVRGALLSCGKPWIGGQIGPIEHAI
jgi:hypothetical protein